MDARDSTSHWHAWANERIAEAVLRGGAGVNTVVISEASVRAKDPDLVPGWLESFGMELLPLPPSAAVPAAKAFAIYLGRLRAEGKRIENKTPLPDFLIGAHAQAEAFELVTRDPDRIRTYFPKVVLTVP